ncbi:alpha/beta fold hydrolase [Metabacillus niabensis]|uniref:alpha/beta fold hydrolase n=1 Tax=Metabacillus niabensis TaxID=324854 RepID=UPI001CFA648A|nr:alpha/beta fold hydrolase [Metabacillus niabensis]
MYGRHPEVAAIIKGHETTANGVLTDAGSQLLYEKFSSNVSTVFGLSASVGGSLITLDIAATKSTVDGWISDLQTCLEEAWRKYDPEDDESGTEFMRIQSMSMDINDIIMNYNSLKYDLDDIELAFENAVRLYRSPVRSALTDIRILYNAENNVSGDFSGFNNVSVYVHGIEDTSNKFLQGATEGAQVDDIIVRMLRNGDVEYFIVTEDDKGNKVMGDVLNFEQIESSMNNNARVHIVYDTEQKNEHRQETSDDLAEKLNEMGLINETTKIDMFGHSYGGRRSLQFAMDYPDHVRSITTIGTPYDTNTLGSLADSARWLAEIIGQDPKNTSDYLDFNLDNQNDNEDMLYSNAYTDMRSEPMTDDIHHLKSANPEVYRKLLEMDITASAGYRTEQMVSYSPYYYQPPTEYKTSSDDTVSVKSQTGEILGELVDQRPQFEIDHGTGVTDPAHIYEIEDSDYIELIKEVNDKQKE